MEPCCEGKFTQKIYVKPQFYWVLLREKEGLTYFLLYLKKICFMWNPVVRKFFLRRYILNHNSAFFFSGEQRGFLKLISNMLSSFHVSWSFSFLVCAGEVCIGYCTGQIFNLTKRGDYEWLLMWYCFQISRLSFLSLLYCSLPFSIKVSELLAGQGNELLAH